MSSDGTRVAIGAYGNDAAGDAAGHVRVYAESGGTWTQVGADIDGEAAGDSPGLGIDVLGRHARGDRRIWERRRWRRSPATCGCTRRAAGRGPRWAPTSTARLRVTFPGISVSMSSDGTRVAIGAYGNDAAGDAAGHVRVYAESGGTWTQVGADIDGEAAGDLSGISVSMSSDGTRVAIGAYGNDAAGDAAGHVRVYAESGGTWTQVGADIDGEAAGDLSGCSVSMSSDGTRVAIGAYGNDAAGDAAGHVRVYAESGGTWTQVGADIDGEAAGDLSGSRYRCPRTARAWR